MARWEERRPTLTPGTLPPKPPDKEKEFFQTVLKLFVYWLIHKIFGR
jgi:hypothetical protein